MSKFSGRSMDRGPVAAKFFAPRPDRLWGPPGFLCNGCRVSFPRIKLPGRDVVHQPPCNAEVKNLWKYTSLTLVLRGMLYGGLHLSLCLPRLSWKCINEVVLTLVLKYARQSVCAHDFVFI
jgi:hypothetical protein